MGWHINLITNTVVVNEACAQEIFEIGQYDHFDDITDVTEDSKLFFNPDHMEHMSYVDNEKIQEVLKKYKVEGDICFSSNEGDNSGESWGYRFDGEGGMTFLTGEIQFKTVKKEKKKKK